MWPPFVPSTSLEDVVAHIEALAKFTQQALNDRQQNLSLSPTEMSLNYTKSSLKAVLQNRMAVDTITAL